MRQREMTIDFGYGIGMSKFGWIVCNVKAGDGRNEMAKDGIIMNNTRSFL